MTVKPHDAQCHIEIRVPEIEHSELDIVISDVTLRCVLKKNPMGRSTIVFIILFIFPCSETELRMNHRLLHTHPTP